MQVLWILVMGVIFMNPNHDDPKLQKEVIAVRQITAFDKQKACEDARLRVQDRMDALDYTWFYNGSGKQAIHTVYTCVEERKN